MPVVPNHVEALRTVVEASSLDADTKAILTQLIDAIEADRVGLERCISEMALKGYQQLPPCDGFYPYVYDDHH